MLVFRGMKQIDINKGKYTLVDDEDYEWLNDLTWSYGKLGYVFKQGFNNKPIYLHHLVLLIQYPSREIQVDHIDGNPLNNQKSNLRLVTRSQQAMNRKKKAGSQSPFKGVRKYNKSKWSMRIGEKSIYGFKQEHHAALAYDLWAKDLYREYARTNFPIVSHH